MDTKIKNNVIYISKFLIPIIIVIGLFLGGVTAGIITFEKQDIITGQATATVLLDFGDGSKFEKTMTLENSTVFDFLLKLEKQGEISIKTTYWASFDGYSIDSIIYQEKKYEGDTNHYWSFSVNDLISMEGADKVYVNNDDIIKWEYVKF